MSKKLCRNCLRLYNSEGISDLCPNCRKRRAARNLLPEDRNSGFGKAYKMMGSADTNIFTAPGKAIFGAINAGKKLSRSTDGINEGFEQISQSFKGMEAEIELKKRKAALANAYKKARYDSMSEGDQRVLDEQVNLATNQALCVMMGFLMGIIATICGIIYGSWSWYISFVLFPIPLVLCYLMRKVTFLGYFAAAFIFAVVIGGIGDGIIILVSYLTDVPSILYVLVPVLAAAVGVVIKCLKSKKEGFILVPLTEDEEYEVDSLE